MMDGRWISFGAVLVAIGVALAGWFVGDGFRQGRLPDRYVTVKGLAEREVTADLALWPLRFVATGNDLGAVQAESEQDAAAVRAFLSEQGIPAAAVSVEGFEMTDVLAQPYRSGPVESRYIISQRFMVRSAEVDVIQAVSQKLSELAGKGVVLGNEGLPFPGPYYLFTRLNDIKPEMIAEATGNARASAEQFAADAGSRVGSIRRASQGLFQILARDKAPGVVEQRQALKTVRVVSTVQFSLQD